MTRQGKIVLAVLALGSILGLVVATNAWFVSMNHTPPGKINTALVRYLPEGGARSFSSLLTYGNLVSGNGVDPDGTPLVLPGDRLIASARVENRGTTAAPQLVRVARTSIARPRDDGSDGATPETVDTVIHWEVREYERPDGSEVELTYQQRDLMDAPPALDLWYDQAAPDTAIDPPTLNVVEYDITTTSDSSEVEGTDGKGQPTTTTTTVVTTTYTPRKEGATGYLHTVTTKRTITKENATITPTEDAALWLPTPPAQYIKATETVLFVKESPTTEKPDPLDLPTRSYLVLEEFGAEGLTVTGPNETIPVALAVGNLSTTESCLRVGLNVRLTAPGGTPVALTLKGPDKEGTYYFGTTAKDDKNMEHFIELLAFRPHSEVGKYSWTAVADGASPWALWDLKVGDSTAVPAIGEGEEAPPSPAAGEGTAPTETASPTASPAPAPTPEAYTVTKLLGIVSRPPAYANEAPIADEVFEQLFNQLYCDKIPTITVHLSYYARQSAFMEWNEFYSEDITLNMPK